MNNMIEKLTTKESINTQGEAIRFAYESVKVAEDFAIGFAEWCVESEGKDYNKYKYRNRKELLEIYKKETL